MEEQQIAQPASQPLREMEEYEARASASAQVSV